MRKTLIGLGLCALTPMVLAGCGSAPTTAIQAPIATQAAATAQSAKAAGVRTGRMERLAYELKFVCPVNDE